MPDTMFKTIRLTEAGGLEVSGPYNPKLDEKQKIVGRAFVGFMIIQNVGKNPTRVLDGVAYWDYEAPNAKGKYHDWEALVDDIRTKKAGIEPGTARAIGYAVQAIEYSDAPGNPPGIESFNWCVPVEIKGPPPSPRAQGRAKATG